MIKKITILIITVFITLNVYANDKEFIGKLGTSYAQNLSSWGLDLSFNYIYKIDPYFVIGGEADFFWINWENKLETKTGTITEDVVQTTNSYLVPLFFNAQVRLPNLKKYIFVEPSITIGLGYAMMLTTYNQPEFYDIVTSTSYSKESIVKFYHGFTWQFILSAAYKPSEESRISFIGDFGYRGVGTENDGDKIDASGIILRIGVKIDF